MFCTVISGDIYEGEYKANQMNGFGVLACANGDSYAGDFCDDLFHSPNGMYIQAEESVFEGNWSFGEKSSFGVMKYSNGALYEGEWLHNKQEGQAKYKDRHGESLA